MRRGAPIDGCLGRRSRLGLVRRRSAAFALSARPQARRLAGGRQEVRAIRSPRGSANGSPALRESCDSMTPPGIAAGGRRVRGCLRSRSAGHSSTPDGLLSRLARAVRERCAARVTQPAARTQSGAPRPNAVPVPWPGSPAACMRMAGRPSAAFQACSTMHAGPRSLSCALHHHSVPPCRAPGHHNTLLAFETLAIARPLQPRAAPSDCLRACAETVLSRGVAVFICCTLLASAPSKSTPSASWLSGRAPHRSSMKRTCSRSLCPRLLTSAGSSVDLLTPSQEAGCRAGTAALDETTRGGAPPPCGTA